jgi:cytidylate kinase
MDHLDPDITSHITERQMRLWNAIHSIERAKTAHYRFITISRDEGSGSDVIVKALSEELGWRMYDKEIVNYIAHNNHVRESMVRELDEKNQSLMHETILRLLQMTETAPFGAEEYHEALLRTLATIAAQGRAILVGRGANFALARSEHGLHIRITASLENRIGRIAQLFQLPHDEARRRLHATDSERRAFIRRHFKQDFDDQRFYDLIINTDHLSTDQVVLSILSVLFSNEPLIH